MTLEELLSGKQHWPDHPLAGEMHIPVKAMLDGVNTAIQFHAVDSAKTYARLLAREAIRVLEDKNG